VAGIPLFFISSIYFNVVLPGHRHRSEQKARFGYLYQKYRHGCWYWETMLMMRKVLVRLLRMMTSSQAVLVQVSGAFFLFLSLWFLHMQYDPYIEKYLNELDAIDLTTHVFFMYAGSLFLTGRLTTALTASYAIFVLVINLIVVAKNIRCVRKEVEESLPLIKVLLQPTFWENYLFPALRSHARYMVLGADYKAVFLDDKARIEDYFAEMGVNEITKRHSLVRRLERTRMLGQEAEHWARKWMLESSTSMREGEIYVQWMEGFMATVDRSCFMQRIQSDWTESSGSNDSGPFGEGPEASQEELLWQNVAARALRICAFHQPVTAKSAGGPAAGLLDVVKWGTGPAPLLVSAGGVSVQQTLLEQQRSGATLFAMLPRADRRGTASYKPARLATAREVEKALEGLRAREASEADRGGQQEGGEGKEDESTAAAAENAIAAEAAAPPTSLLPPEDFVDVVMLSSAQARAAEAAGGAGGGGKKKKKTRWPKALYGRTGPFWWMHNPDKNMPAGFEAVQADVAEALRLARLADRSGHSDSAARVLMYGRAEQLMHDWRAHRDKAAAALAARLGELGEGAAPDSGEAEAVSEQRFRGRLRAELAMEEKLQVLRVSLDCIKVYSRVELVDAKAEGVLWPAHIVEALPNGSFNVWNESQSELELQVPRARLRREGWNSHRVSSFDRHIGAVWKRLAGTEDAQEVRPLTRQDTKVVKVDTSGEADTVHFQIEWFQSRRISSNLVVGGQGDSSWAAVGYYDGTVDVWNIHTQARVHKLVHGSPVRHVVISPTGSYLHTFSTCDCSVWFVPDDDEQVRLECAVV
jgi:hypothetical protein